MLKFRLFRLTCRDVGVPLLGLHRNPSADASLQCVGRGGGRGRGSHSLVTLGSGIGFTERSSCTFSHGAISQRCLPREGVAAWCQACERAAA